jgi:hypothetical protein
VSVWGFLVDLHKIDVESGISNIVKMTEVARTCRSSRMAVVVKWDHLLPAISADAVGGSLWLCSSLSEHVAVVSNCPTPCSSLLKYLRCQDL